LKALDSFVGTWNTSAGLGGYVNVVSGGSTAVASNRGIVTSAASWIAQLDGC
jgi:hypothetical protein